jgi:hypothetical protein
MLRTLAEPNAAFWWIVVGTLAALLAVIYLPPAAALFRFAPPGAGELGIGVLAGLAGVFCCELWKGSA